MKMGMPATRRARGAPKGVGRFGIFAVVVLLGVAGWATGCGGDGGTEPEPPQPPPNRGPVAVGSIPAQTVIAGETVTLDVRSYFNDPDRDALTYTATTSAPGTASPTISGSALTIAGVSPGSAAVTVTARDPGGLSATQSVSVTVERANRAPVPVGNFPSPTVRAGETVEITLTGYFSDPDGDSLTYTASTSNAGIASPTISGSTLTIAGVAQGTATVTITARDPGGLSAQQATTVTVERANRAPVTVDSIPSRTMLVGDTVTVDMSSYFRDPDGDPLTYTATSASDVVGVSVSDSILTVMGTAVGTDTVRVTAADPGGLPVSQIFAVSVVTSPTPTTVTIMPDTAGLSAPGDTVRLRAVVRDQNGRVMAGFTVTWTSSDTSVATVDASGLVTAVGYGTAMVSASAGRARGMAEITVVNPDRAALEALYHATDGPAWRYNSNWLTDAPLDDWSGVDTDAFGRVTRLDLSGGFDLSFFQTVKHGLKGPIPPVLGDLEHLAILDLAHNLLTGPVPPELAKLNALTHLHLNSNELTGTIPEEIGDLGSLKSLNLGGALGDGFNRLTGPIPARFGDLDNLTHLNLSGNLLTGQIPTELARLNRLTYLNLSGNLLTGPIPSQLADLDKLEHLLLAVNRLAGSIPVSLGGLHNLTRLSLAQNSLGGQIPSELASLDKLTRLDLSFNGLDGPIPAALGNLRNLRSLNLGVNRLTGSIPPEIGRLAVLRNLSLAGNGLTGSIPPEIGRLAVLRNLSLAGNGLTGPIPSEFAAFDSLYSLNLANNSLTGAIPSALGDLSQLSELVLADNRFAGALPVSLTELPLQLFHYYNTGLCVPDIASLRAWLNGIADHRGTGVACRSAPSVESFITKFEVDGVSGRFREGSLPAEGNGPNINFASDSVDIINGGALLSTVTSTARFSTVYLSVQSDTTLADGYYETSLSTATDSATVVLQFAQSLPASRLNLVLAASSSGGGVGSHTQVAAAVTEVGSGTIQVSLSWNSRADLDLHVVEPSQEEIFWSNKRSRSGGELDLDSNAACESGPMNENITWMSGSPPQGIYTVRVNHWSDCGAASSNYVVRVITGRQSVVYTGRFTGEGNAGGLDDGRTITQFAHPWTPNPSFDIEVEYGSSVGAPYRPMIRSVADLWSQILKDTELADIDLPASVSCHGTTVAGSRRVDDLLVRVDVEEIDGEGNVLAQAGPCWVRGDGDGLPIVGRVIVDRMDLHHDGLHQVLMHEFAHVLGIGGFWTDRLNNPGDSIWATQEDTHFPGINAVAAFNGLGGQGYTGGKVPVQSVNRGSNGNYVDNGHWREIVLGRELMTPTHDAGRKNPLSLITIHALRDLGYTVDARIVEAYSVSSTTPPGDVFEGRRAFLGDDILRGPMIVVDQTGRVVRIIRN